VIVIGYGRFGQTVGQMLLGQGIQVTLIDSDPETIAVSGDFGMKVHYGDGIRVDLLRRAGAEEAQALIFCIDGDRLDEASLGLITQAFPNVAILVRAYDRRHLIRMGSAPVAGAVRDVFESAISLARQAMEVLGVDMAEIDNTETDYRERDAARLQEQRDTGNLRAGMDRMFNQRDAKIEEDCG
jgi:CPA2 family monovalent cation:H+ antiporter-2/glutathione-regulated potassium-efflux system protein KefB